jgi:hypothetical protein
MRNSPPINAAAGLAVVGAAVMVFLAANDLPPSTARALHAAIGQAIARETLSQIKPGAGVVAIVRDTSAFRHPQSDFQFRAFADVLRAAGSPLVATQSLQVDPLRNIEVPSGDFYELIRKAPPGTAIVSFMGPPLLSDEQRGRLGEIRSRIVAFCPGAIPARVDLRSLFDNGLLHAAVVEQEPTAAPPTQGGRDNSSHLKPADWFAAHYRILHSTDDPSLAPGTSAARETR